MRKNKFRIYDKKRKEWLHDTEHAISLLGEVIILGAILQRQDGSSVKLSELNDLVVMQYTGLKDKNGVEIYEQDYLYCGEGTSIWKMVITVEGVIPFNDGIFDVSRYEIIGNLFDNPEVFEEKK